MLPMYERKEESASRQRTWDERLVELSVVIADTGALPRPTIHPILARWLYDQNSRKAKGLLRPDRAAALEAVTHGRATRRRSADRLAELEAFWAEHGRLPRRTTVKSDETRLAEYLVMNLRTQIRKGTISAGDLARARRIPGAVNIRTVPDQLQTLNELRAYVEQHSVMPGSGGTAEEERLNRWASNNTKGDPGTKSAKLRERHLAIEEIRTMSVARGTAKVYSQLAAAEKFCAENGFRPGTAAALPEEERTLADWLNRRFNTGPSSMPDDLSRRRLQSLAALPSRSDMQWSRNLQALRDDLDAGAPLPTSWSQEHFTWLSVQRRDHRAGIMPQWKVQALSQVPGIITERRRAA